MDLWNRFRFWYNIQPPVFRLVATINVVVFLVLNGIIQNAAPELGWLSLALEPGLPGIATHPWQLLTYSFLHGGFLHLLFNLLWLYWLGKDLERDRGSTVFAGIYFGGAIGAAVLTVLLHAAFPNVGWFMGPVVGASGAVLAVLAAAATFNPHVSITLFLLGRIPLPMLVVGFLILDFVMTAASGGNTALGAHWGGALAGFLIARAERGGKNVTSWARFFVPGASSRRSPASKQPTQTENQKALDRLENWLEERKRRKERGVGGATIHDMPSAKRSNRVRQDDASETDVDKLLDKISEHGYDALTDEEKKILYEASRK